MRNIIWDDLAGVGPHGSEFYRKPECGSFAFVTLKTGVHVAPELRDELRNHVAKEIGPVAKPDDIRFAEALPKTRSGKIMRRLLKQVAAGGEIKGDTTTLEDFNVLAKLTAEE